jgi:hypothetical protein
MAAMVEEARRVEVAHRKVVVSAKVDMATMATTTCLGGIDRAGDDECRAQHEC